MTRFNFNINDTEHNTQKISNKLNSEGFVKFDNAISKRDLNFLKNEVKKLIEEKGERYFSVINPHKKEFSKILSDLEFFSLARKISEKKLNRKIDQDDFLSVLRVITGNKTDQQSYLFHFDAYILTILVPINIPDSGNDDGHLILFPNYRKSVRLTLVNFIEKIFYQNLISRKLIKFLSKKNLEKYILKLKPGSIYFFWGYQSLHANMPINKNLLRSTLLLHFGTVHNKSILDKIIKYIRHMADKKNFQDN